MIKLLPPARARLGWSRQPLPVAAVLGDLKENAERYEVKSLPVPVEASLQAIQGEDLFCEFLTRRSRGCMFLVTNGLQEFRSRGL